MATYQSDIMVAQTAVGGAKLVPSELGGRVRIAHGVITPASAYAAGSVIELVRLPKGARVLPISQLHFAAGQNASLKVTVGDAADADRYLAAVAPGASETTVDLTAERTADFAYDAETVLTLTTSGAALATGKVIVFDIYYVVD